MPRYFFHVRNQTSYIRDEIGSELKSADGARARGADLAGEILTSDLREGRTEVVFDVEVEDDSRARVYTLYIVGTVETGMPRADPPH